MDLLDDIGHTDQLTSAREENKVLIAKVKDLTLRIHELQVENETLKAEVEGYRGDYLAATRSSSVIPTSSNDDDVGNCDVTGRASRNSGTTDGNDDFITSGNGMYPTDPAVTLHAIHGPSNPLCCTLHPDDTLLATGGADSNIRLYRWGLALAPGSQSSVKAVDDSIVISCGAPVICCAFALVNKGRGLPVIAAGCMDGSVRLAYCGSMEWNNACPGDETTRLFKLQGGDDSDKTRIKHTRYVKTLCWSPSEPILASASADGTVQLTRVGNVNNENNMTVSIDVIKTMHFNDAVEAMCYVNNGDTLCCYIRGTSYLSYFDLKDGFKVSKMSLNGGSVGGFHEHVSFAVLSMQPSPCGKYIALATDTSRNIIMEVSTERIVRNLYGHKNDSYSNPKIAWSNNGQYLYGNSQDDNCIFVWDIASTSIVKRLDENYGGHGGFVRDIYSSSHSETVVSVSFDKTAKVWLRDV